MDAEKQDQGLKCEHCATVEKRESIAIPPLLAAPR